MTYFTQSAAGVIETARPLAQAIPPGSVVLPDALRLRIEESVNATFATQFAFQHVAIDQQLATGAFSADVEALRKPASALDRREGALIEAAIGHVLATSGKYACRTSAPVEIYREAVNVIDVNQGGDVDPLAIRLPLVGAATSRMKIDILAIDPSRGIAYLLDVKRSTAGVTDDHMRMLKAATFTVRASLAQCGIHVKAVVPQLVVWWGDPTGTFVTRSTIDEAFGLPIRCVVDAVVQEFRSQISLRIAELWGTKARAASDALAAQERLPRAEIDKLTRALATLELPIVEKIAPLSAKPAKKRGRPRKVIAHH